jgi:superkiller protein 3
MKDHFIDFQQRRHRILRNKINTKPVDYSHALSLIQRGDIEEAVVAFEKLAEIHSRDATVWYNFAFALSERGYLSHAIEAYHKSLEVDPFFNNARFNLALEYISLNKIQKAIAELNRVVENNPNDPQASFELGRCYEIDNLLDFALFHYNRVYQLDENFSLIHYARANVYFKLKNYSEAALCCRKELSRNPGFSEAHRMLKMIQEAIDKKSDENEKNE